MHKGGQEKQHEPHQGSPTTALCKQGSVATVHDAPARRSSLVCLRLAIEPNGEHITDLMLEQRLRRRP